MLLQTSIRSIGTDTAVITLTGALTLGTSLKTADMQIHTAIEKGAHRLVIEMSGVPFIDSAGLGSLVHASGVVQERGGTLRLAGVTDRVATLLRMTRVDTLLPMDPDEATALSALNG